jgi:hypothetical protein
MQDEKHKKISFLERISNLRRNDDIDDNNSNIS